MTVTKELLGQLVDEHLRMDGDKSLADYLADELRNIDRVIEERQKLSRALEAEERRHESTEKDIAGKLKELRKTCRHLAKTYHPDPSGNSDSHYECNHCGAIL